MEKIDEKIRKITLYTLALYNVLQILLLKLPFCESFNATLYGCG